MPESIDLLKPEHHHIDLGAHSAGEFDSEDLVLSKLFDDILFVEYIDLSEDGSAVKRGLIYVPENTLSKAWRKGIVRIVGTNAKEVKVGDIVIFPNDKGIPVANLNILVDGQEQKVKRGVFLNEDRLFGGCAKRQ